MPEENKPKTPQTREQLIRLLKKAAELEHQLLCAYLVTAYTTKQHDELEDGGFAPASDDPMSNGFKQREFMFEDFKSQFGFGAGPRIVLIDVAVQEMLHLTVVSNLLTAISPNPRPDIPYLWRENFPLSPSYLRETFGYNTPSGDAWIGHWSFDLDAMQGWEWFEDPKEKPFVGPQYQGNEVAEMKLNSFIDAEMGVSTLVELYETIAKGFVKLGELEVLSDGKRLFINNTEQQIEGEYSPFETPDVQFAVPDIFHNPHLATRELSRFPPEWKLVRNINTVYEALDAINLVVVQGEGDTEDWKKFVSKLGYDFDQFPSSISESGKKSHFEKFEEVRTKLESLLNEDPNFKPGRAVHVFNNADRSQNDSDRRKLGYEISDLFDDVYCALMAILSAAFRSPIPGQDSTRDEILVARYERITLAQTGLAAMLYVLSPFGNALPQLKSGFVSDDGDELGIAPRFHFRIRSYDWDSLIVQLNNLGERAIGLVDRLPDQEVWLQPNYLNTIDKDSGEHWPKLPIKAVMSEFVGKNLKFISSRFRNVRSNRPIANSQGDLHGCMGLNECRGLDITGAAERAGEGVCATAIPHTCANLNQCNNQSMCGYGSPAAQNAPGANDGKGSGGCQTPALPSALNTAGNNTPERDPAIFAKGKGNVWRHARILFEKRMEDAGIPFGPSKGPGGVGGDDFPGSI